MPVTAEHRGPLRWHLILWRSKEDRDLRDRALSHQHRSARKRIKTHFTLETDHAQCSSPSTIQLMSSVVLTACSDDGDINREIKNFFTRTNVPCRWFKRCCLPVKVRPFELFACVCMILLCGLLSLLVL